MAENQPTPSNDRRLEAPIATVRLYAEGKNQDELEEAMQSWHPDSHVELVPTETIIEGKEAVESFFQAFLEAFDDYEGIIESIHGDHQQVTVSWRLTGKFAGPFLGFEPTGERLDVPIVSLIEFEDDLIESEELYFDLATLSDQAGIDLERIQYSNKL